ncbi:MAG: hypothetical protein AAF127_09660 [Pseudomonadota bacterium]
MRPLREDVQADPVAEAQAALDRALGNHWGFASHRERIIRSH